MVTHTLSALCVNLIHLSTTVLGLSNKIAGNVSVDGCWNGQVTYTHNVLLHALAGMHWW